MRANAARFAAYKAHYVEHQIRSIMQDDRLPEAQRQQMADAAMRTFHHWGDAETNYATQSAQMAKKWQDFEADGDNYLLQYRTANDEKVRGEHQKLHGITLPVHDDFWKEYYPPLGWNCRCTVVQVPRDKYPVSNSIEAISAGLDATKNTPSFRFNPGIEKKAFPEGVSYLKRGGKKAEESCRGLSRDDLQHNASHSDTLKKTCKIVINGKECTIGIEDWGISEAAQSMWKSKKFWLKQEIINNFDRYLPYATYNGPGAVDLTHNSGRTLRRKKHFLSYHYFTIEVVPGQSICIQIVEHDSGNYFLYTITSASPV